MNVNAITTVAGASAFQQSQTADAVGSAVAVKTLDAERTAGAGVLKLLAASLTGVGRNLDVVG